MTRMRGWLAAVSVLAAGGCTAMQSQPETAAGQAQHVVICWLKPGADRDAVLHTANDYARLPGVLDVRAGYALSSAVPNVEAGYDIAMVVTFRNDAALRAAEANPILQQINDGPMRDNVAKTVVYDTVLQNYQVGKIYSEESEAATRQRRAAAMKQQQDQIDHTK
ncbi:MAG: Dabb family protein [Tepidisphaeraceae bacterium]